GYHRGLFEKVSEDHMTQQVSGLLLLSPSWILHVVESCSSTIHFIIRDLASLQNQGPSALLQDIKVLVVAHNIPTRLFPHWYVVTAMSPVAHPPDPMQSQSTAEAVAECLTFLCQVAASIQSFEDDDEDRSEVVHTAAPELLIPAEATEYLFNAEECFRPGDFVRMYLSPSQVVLDSETVWPIPSRFS
ncbi:Uncharacterized protein C7orf62, partial [Buceros rhinoceros silvestris]